MKTYKRSFGDMLRQVDPVLFSCSLAISLISLLTIVSGLETFGMRTLIMQTAMTVIMSRVRYLPLVRSSMSTTPAVGKWLL